MRASKQCQTSGTGTEKVSCEPHLRMEVSARLSAQGFRASGSIAAEGGCQESKNRSFKPSKDSWNLRVLDTNQIRDFKAAGIQGKLLQILRAPLRLWDSRFFAFLPILRVRLSVELLLGHSVAMAAKCVHKGCGKVFTDPEEECLYHPGPPIFHEGQKGIESVFSV